ncbi:MAG: type I-C CRISPR-associated protein Cas5 [Schwartzia sp.]|nr:type I-C CRISPR-associated protein Cas5 [Schwartzia sp. (in: firmicutes)]
MSYGIQLEVWGEYALFTRPELKAERVSYDCMTPSAARGILEAILWHPGMKWVVDRISVGKPIQFANIRRNEVKSKASADQMRKLMKGTLESACIATSDDIQQRASMVLKDVRYLIEAHFILTDKANASDNPGKFSEMFRRRASKGQSYHQPYFGCREFPAKFAPRNEAPFVCAHQDETRDLGLMLYDMDYSDREHIEPTFFRAVLKNGVMDLEGVEVYR